MWRWRWLVGVLILAGCEMTQGGLEWHWPVLHWAGGIITGVAVGYGIFRYSQHHLREARRDDRAARRDEPTPKT